MDNINDVSVGPMPESNFLKPLRITYTQNGKKRCWDFVKVHQSVSCLLFNTSRNVLIFVKQFRPPVYATSISDYNASDVDWSNVPVHLGMSVELCAGIIDSNLPDNEIMKKEVLEECGYDVPLENFQRLITYQADVTVNGDQVTVFYAECTDEMKVCTGGGLADEGELIDVVEMTIPQIREYISQDTVLSPAEVLHGIAWFLMNKAPSFLS